ncbi:hypothetical protein AHAS_Ahas05G0288100 [Arachis hypogaea]
MRFPEGLQPLQFSRMSIEFSEENRAIPVNMIESLRLHQGSPLHYAFLPNKPTMPNQPSVWRQWNEGTALELVYRSIGNSYTESEVLRCIHVGLVCVQERAEDIPTMSSIVLMLSSEAVLMPRPKDPNFSLRKNHRETDSSSSNQDKTWSVN